MMTRPFALPVLAAGILALPAATQSRLWIVDAANGPGTDFNSLPAAVSAASPGDRIFVRPGGYQGIVTSKPLSIVGGPNVTVSPGGAGYVGMHVSNLPAGTRFIARGLQVQTIPLGSGIVVFGCSGTVVLEDIVHNTPIQITDCADVRLTNCTVPGLEFVRSEAAIERCTVQATFGATAAIVADASALVLSRCDIRGSDEFGPFPTGPAIASTAGAMIVTGDGSGGIAAGAGTSPSPAIVGSGTLTLDPNVVLVSAGSAPRVGPGITVATRTIPSLRADGAPIGGTVGVELFAPATAPYVLVVGLPAAPIPLPILFGSLWLDDAIVAATGAIPANGRATFSLPIPNDPFAFGHAFTWQAAADHRGVAVSNPSTYVHGF